MKYAIRSLLLALTLIAFPAAAHASWLPGTWTRDGLLPGRLVFLNEYPLNSYEVAGDFSDEVLGVGGTYRYDGQHLTVQTLIPYKEWIQFQGQNHFIKGGGGIFGTQAWTRE